MQPINAAYVPSGVLGTQREHNIEDEWKHRKKWTNSPEHNGTKQADGPK